jgi:hypothetical protein
LGSHTNTNKVDGDEKMLFIATLTHSPENCLSRPENAKAAQENRKFWERRAEIEKETGVKFLAAYVAPNEHTFYVILETDNYKGISRALGPIMLTHHMGRITPVMTLEEASKP